MNTKELLNFYGIQHRIFGVCPNSGKIFRLSSCHIYTIRPEHDWLQKIETKLNRVDRALTRFEEIEQDKLNLLGRQHATKIVKKFDKVFTPRRYNPNDSVGIFDPIDYVVFNGLEKGNLRNIVVLDRDKRHKKDAGLQNNIASIIEKEKYEWLTLRIDEKGKITDK